MRVRTKMRQKPQAAVAASISGKSTSTIRQRPKAIPDPERRTSPEQLLSENIINLYRLDGVGDIIFMEPAIRKLKAYVGDMETVLQTRKQYQDIGRFIGFDRCSIEERKAGNYDDGVNLNWALENHAGSRVLDRVSIWEDVLHIPIGDEKVRLYPNTERGLDILKTHPNYDANKLALYFEPFSRYPNRSLFGTTVTEMLPRLRSRFNVIMAFPTVTMPHFTNPRSDHARFVSEKLDVQRHCMSAGACAFTERSIADWFSIVSACDVAVSIDTASLYIAAGSGVPSVGLFNHVEPWLRVRRFDKVRAISLRQARCRCGHHSPCSMDHEVCKELLDMDFLFSNIDAVLAGEYGYLTTAGEPLLQPRIEFRIDDPDDDAGAVRRTTFSIAEAARGLNYVIRYEEPEMMDEPLYSIDVVAGEIIVTGDLWYTFSEAIKARA